MKSSSTDSGNTADREIVATRVFDAPRELVFGMWTDPRHVSNWWGPVGFTTTTHEMDVRPGGVWRFVMHGPDGRDYKNKIVYAEVDRPSRLVYDHVSGPHFHVTVDFVEQGAKTSVTVRMLFNTAAERDKTVRDFGAVEGLHQTLGRLAEQLAQASRAGGVEDFVISRTFDAPRDVVWKAWTERERLMQWFGPKGFTMPFAKLDLRPGGTLHYRMESSDGAMTMWGRFVFREIVPQEKLVWVNSFSDEHGGLTRHPGAEQWPLEMLTVVTFEERGGKTTVTVRWSPIDPTEAERRTFDEGRESMTMGWTGTFEQLEAHLGEMRHGA